MVGRRNLMRKISGGEIRFLFFLVGDVDNERTDREYMCYVFCLILLSSLCLSSVCCIFFGPGSINSFNNGIANPDPNAERLGYCFLKVTAEELSWGIRPQTFPLCRGDDLGVDRIWLRWRW